MSWMHEGMYVCRKMFDINAFWKEIKRCEGSGHKQTVSISTHMKRITQVCFDCKDVKYVEIKEDV